MAAVIPPSEDEAIQRDQRRLRRNFLVATVATLLLGSFLSAWVRWPTGEARPSTAVPRDACTSDEECQVSTFGGCCDVCPVASHAVSKAAEAFRRQRCTAMDCATRGEPCPAVAFPPGVTARCQAGSCALLSR